MFHVLLFLIGLSVVSSSCSSSPDRPSGEAEGDSDTAPVSECEDIACWSPPQQVCADGSGVTVYAPDGYCEGGDCVYPAKRTACESDLCVDGHCEQSPCQGITCNHPDASNCSENNGVIRYAKEGFCSEGECYYASREETCDGSCREGVCGHYTCHGVYCDKSEARFCKDDGTLQIFASRGVCSSSTGEADCRYAGREVACEDGCRDGACLENSCKGMVCVVPEARYCDGDDLATWEPRGRCVDGECKYERRTESCEFGCEGGECRENPCIGVICMSPHASYCENDTMLRHFLPDGVCDEGVCVYASESTICEHGCLDGQCVGDPCAGVVCNTPPATYCEDDTVLSFWNGEPGVCEDGFCVYETQSASCEGRCVDGRCADDFCIGVVCDAPGADFCLDDETLYTFLSTDGACADGVCGYAAETETCPAGCVDGACLPEVAVCEADTCNGRGSCDASTGKIVCSCEPGWQGNRCETDIDECAGGFDGCGETEECVNTAGGYECVCADGLVWNGTICVEDVSVCDPNPCFNGGECEDADGGVLCICPPGFGGELCETGGLCVDGDGDGYGENCEDGEDCDDDDATRYVWAVAFPDTDLDGVGGDTEETVCAGDNLPPGYVTQGGDCNDDNALVWQILTGYRDADGDGFGAGDLLSMCAGDGLGEGLSTRTGDCDDNAEAISPDAAEVLCNGIDDDCSAETPDAPDEDSDGYAVCDDCDDGNGSANPGRAEIVCNGVDDDCNAETLDAPDGDSDGYAVCDDCDDGNGSVNPGREEIVCNGVDDDCNAETSDAPDGDSDGYTVCDDCDDGNGLVNPGATEIVCNGTDDDCNAETSDAPDGDSDGYAVCDDCDDGNGSVNPGATEIVCNGVDDDCNAGTSDGPDGDSDGYAVCDDCDDGNGAVNPGATETVCNGTDDDCNAATSDAPDGDGDGFTACEECDDENGEVHPGAAEIICNGLDDDCNAATSDLPDFDIDVYHCGGCGNRCSAVDSLWPQGTVPDHVADFDCLAGTCVIEECDNGYRDDPSSAYDDCDIDLSTQPVNIDIGGSAWRVSDMGSERWGLDLAAEETLQLDAQCTSSQGNSWDCTDSVVWTASSTTILSVSGGTVSGLSVGTAAVYATLGGVSSDYLYLNVAEYTIWLDIDEPSGAGDYELVTALVPCAGSEPIGIECRTVSDLPWITTGQVVSCAADRGFSCANDSQPDGDTCQDYKVRFVCP